MKKERNFIKQDIKVDSWAVIEPYLDNLVFREINSSEELLQWWKDRSELEAFLSEDMAWRYIKMSCDTENDELAENFNFFVNEIEPKASEYSDTLDKKLIQNKYADSLDSDKYFIPMRSIKRSIEMFRKENIPIFSALQKEIQEFGKISGAMSVTQNGEEMTLQKAANFLKDTDRAVRKEIYEKINNRRYEDKDQLNNLLDKLIKKRQQVAENTGYKNYRDYKFDAMHRFDYTVDDCRAFHNSVKETILPLTKKIQETRKEKMGLKNLRPYDMAVDPDGKKKLEPFSTSAELIEKSIEIFSKIKPQYGEYLSTMKKEGFLDLESRKGKAPGGFNYPLYESNIPFIFMNATGNIRDVETLMHEGGHAIHSFLSSDLEPVDFKSLPSEVAELASMSMELISLEHRNLFFDNEDDFIRAKRTQLEGILHTLPWVAIIDKFQQELYLNPEHSHEERKQLWNGIMNEFSTGIVDNSGYEKFRDIAWQKQLHIFEVPFYYIEYGFAQLGAVSVWKNYKENPKKALKDYEAALKLGYSKTIPEIYKTAGIAFNFSKEYIGELAEFVQKELEQLD
ncbi:MAG: M3 family oligoendopeptidase [Bacteroidota bacterium]|nr:M3 family oligoendopeptidase [Bacteroidota bacterium]